MPAHWTGQLIGEIHNAGMTIKEVALEAGLNPKYVSQILNSDAESEKAQARLRAAFEKMLADRGAKDDGNQ